VSLCTRSSLLNCDVLGSGAYVDKIRTGFISWEHSVYGCRIVQDTSVISWEEGSRELLNAISEIMKKNDYFGNLSLLWSQESTQDSGKVDMRLENAHFIKILGHWILHPQSSRLTCDDS
jgi:proteasome activator subunit 4